jgi:hypothetical protein
MTRREDDEIEATIGARYRSMPSSPLSVVLQHLLADLRLDGCGMTDGELLARFVSSRDLVTGMRLSAVPEFQM